MLYDPDEGPVYYREIQKNAYLKRVPEEPSGSKLRPLGHKKPVLKPLWTLFCVHNGRIPYLEQYPLAECSATLSHRPVWRVNLKTARHVTAGVRPFAGTEYDFLIDTNDGSVRMRAPDWESMQDWVITLRNKLHELRILSKGENVYCAAPAPPAPRAAARDPTSPLPPTPAVPPDRVPGIELITPTVPIPPTVPIAPPPPEPEPEPVSIPIPVPQEPVVDISNWEDAPTPSTSQENSAEPRKLVREKSLAKICGQNVCLDNSILNRNVESTDSDEEFFKEIDLISKSVENINFDDAIYKQTVVVNDEKVESDEDSHSDQPVSNVTVIQVSNKPPHTAIPVLGAQNDVFNFNLQNNEPFVNIVNTEVNVQSENGYGTVFDKAEYGHISAATTVNMTAVKVTDANESVYERLCMASTSNEANVSRVKNLENFRKSSLPNLDLGNSESTYECLFPNNNVSGNTTVTLNAETPNGHEINSNRQDNIVNVSAAPNTRVVRTVERSHSQNAYDSTARMREQIYRRAQNMHPKKEGCDKNESTHTKPIWKRGLTEFSLLTRLRGIGQGKRHESPTRHEEDRSGVATAAIVVQRSRPEGRSDCTRRRSSSLSNGECVPMPLIARSAAGLAAAQARRASHPASIDRRRPPLLVDYDQHVWIAWWTSGGTRCNGRTGDRLAAVRGRIPRDSAHAKQLMTSVATPTVDLLFHRVPLAKIYVLNKRDKEFIGIKLDGECNIVGVDPHSPAGRAGLPPPGRWAVTEINNRPINLVKGGEEEMLRISQNGTEVSVLIQPSVLVKKLRAAIKANKSLLSKR